MMGEGELYNLNYLKKLLKEIIEDLKNKVEEFLDFVVKVVFVIKKSCMFLNSKF